MDHRSLKCAIHGEYRVLDGIPRFVENDDFDKHWAAHNQDELPSAKIQCAHDFLAPLAVDFKTKSPFKVLDAGCGDGVHTNVFKELEHLDGYIGVDSSSTAVQKSSNRGDQEGWFLQADVCELPFPDRYFDTAITFGVLEYLDEPIVGLADICRTIKTGGKIGIWTLPEPTGIVGSAFRVLRSIARLLPYRGKIYLAHFLVPALFFVNNKSNISLKNSSWKQCRETLLVNLSPQAINFISKTELIDALSGENFTVILDDLNSPHTIWAKKSNKLGPVDN